MWSGARVHKMAALMLVAGLLAALTAQPVGPEVVLREAIVNFNPGVVLLPQGATSATFENVTITAPEIGAILEANSTELMILAFPGFEASDTIAVSLTGETVVLPDLRSVFKIRFPSGTDVFEVCEELRPLPGVLFADPNGIAEPLLDFLLGNRLKLGLGYPEVVVFYHRRSSGRDMPGNKGLE